MTKTGNYLVCWCNDGYGGCNSDLDFIVQIGTIMAAGVESGQLVTCAAFLPCQISVPLENGVGTEDALQIVLAPHGDTAVQCGLAKRANSAFFSRGSRVSGRYAIDQQGKDVMIYELGEPQMPGMYHICYCQSEGTCSEDLDFFQVLGSIIVEGIASHETRHVCYLRGVCDIAILGNRLGASDLLMLTDPQDSCGMGWDDSSGNFDGEGYLAEDGSRFFIGELTGQLLSGLDRWAYALGTPLRTGNYRLCYCSQRRAEGGVCARRSNFDMPAGDLYVRGSDFEVDRECMQGEPCSVTLRGHVLDDNDRILLFRSNSSCGDTTPGVYPEWIFPVAPGSVQRDNLIPEYFKETFVVQAVAEPGIWNVCYCAHLRGAPPCILPEGQLKPDLKRFSHKAGVVRVSGAIAGVMGVSTDENETYAPLPATPSAVSVYVDSMYAGLYFTCVASDRAAPYLPLRSDLTNCTQTNRADLNDRQQMMPLCWGQGKSLDPSKIGKNIVHIPLEVPVTTALETTELHIWCYEDQFCSNDRCTMPATKTGHSQKFTNGIASSSQTWKSTVATKYTLRVGLSSDYNVAENWPRIKVIKSGKACDRSTLLEKHYISGIDCVPAAMGKCEPHPISSLSSGAFGAHRELVWNNIKINKVGEYKVCYCDRHENFGCAVWQDIGLVEVSGPDDIGFTMFTGNPGKPFKVDIQGQGLAAGDRMRIVPEKQECTSEGTFYGQQALVPAPAASSDISTTVIGDFPLGGNRVLRRLQIHRCRGGKHRLTFQGTTLSAGAAASFAVVTSHRTLRYELVPCL
jgi:hypothetical protein